MVEPVDNNECRSMIIPVFDNEYVRCELDDSLPLLKHRWLKEPSGENFKYNLQRIQEEYLRLKESHHNLAWMADTELLGELDEDVEERSFTDVVRDPADTPPFPRE